MGILRSIVYPFGFFFLFEYPVNFSLVVVNPFLKFAVVWGFGQILSGWVCLLCLYADE